MNTKLLLCIFFIFLLNDIEAAYKGNTSFVNDIDGVGILDSHPCCVCCLSINVKDKSQCGSDCDCCVAVRDCQPCCCCCTNESDCTDCYGVNCASADCNPESGYYEGC
ncbi:uncharacterized protein LOC122505197 [Leptopilina heterotoma]|uniref:uncharacterized protein LOC122505197 n=1 Tax=Leptopilina heterotoma TaxID=63436 RepID=UPI001CA7D15E|nr:uncharacterized protein LOC122505197 [Leptopilina heterotoma]